MQSVKKLVKPLTALLLLHSGFASYRLMPVLENFAPLTFLLPMGEIIIVFILLWEGRCRWARIAAAFFILSFLLFFLIGELFFRIIYLEHFDMISDMRLIPNFFVMLLQGTNLPAGFLRVIAVVITVSVIVLSAYGLMAVIKIIIRKSADNLRILSRRTMKAVLIAAAILLAAGPFDSPVSQTMEMMVRGHLSEPSKISYAVETEKLSEAALQVQEPRWAFPGIEDSDIHFVVIESYGAVLSQKEEYADFMGDVYADLQARLDDEGMLVRSGFTRSPAFGGRSWLADATLVAGVQIANQRMYDERIREGEKAYLLTEMKRKGYWSYYVAPGSTRASEGWKNAYPFDTYLLQDDFDYQGPNISFGTMSDQYMFYSFAANYLKEDKKEFAFYLLVSSHTPFVRIPVYKEDWDFSQKGREYEDNYIKYFENNWLYGNELAEGYLEGIGYSLTTTIHYLTDILDGKNFMLIIGDHQPRKPVSGPDAGYPVLFHIIFSEESHISFPESWTLSSGLVPPALPSNHKDLPEMAAIPHLIEQIIK